MYSLCCLFLISALLCGVFTPWFRDLAVHLGFVDRPNARKLHARPIPRIGGVPIVLALIGATGILHFLPLSGGELVARNLPIAWPVLPAIGLIFATGLLDDLVGLKPWQKLLGQIAAGLVACIAGVSVQAVADVHLPIWLSFVVTVFWLTACTNAFNLIDGLDGVATGVGLFASLTVFIAACLQNNFALALAAAALAGALSGFLRFNFEPASIFLGDSGSLTIGFLLGLYGVVWSQKAATMLAMTAPLMAVSVPLLDTALTVVRRFLRGQSVFSADRGHIHHRLLDCGLTPRGAALALYATCGLAAMFSLLQNFVQRRYSGLIIILFCAVAYLGIRRLGYVELRLAGRLVRPETFRRILNAQIVLSSLEKALANAQTSEHCWIAIRNAAKEFGFTRASMRLDDKTFEEKFGGQEAWTIHLPLSDQAFLSMARDFRSPAEPLAVALFAEIVHRSLVSKLAAFRSTAAASPAVLHNVTHPAGTPHLITAAG